MGYIRAEEILPSEIFALIQEYVDGQNIYIPRKAENRQEWGTTTHTRQELLSRNRCINKEHAAGMKVVELASKYCLSEKSIQRIVRKLKI